MNIDLTSRNALVCGSTQGIGLASAKELALLGANITLVARNEEKLKECVLSLDTNKGQSHNYLVADFANAKAVSDMVTLIASENKVYHIVVNNTGGPAAGPLLNATTDALSDAFAMHLLNYQLIVQAVVPGMKAANFGRVINIISTSVKQPIQGLGVSNTTRWAVAAWAKTLSVELAPFGITVNNVLPGLTETARLEAVFKLRSEETNNSIEETKHLLANAIPTKRFVKAEEVAAAVAFLSSPVAASINGINLPVDGGATASL